MSQRKWNTEEGFEVLTGWDDPLRCFFLTISNGVDRDGETIVEFSNFDENLFPAGLTTGEIKEELESRNIEYPQSLLKDLQRDRKRLQKDYFMDYGVL